MPTSCVVKSKQECPLPDNLSSCPASLPCHWVSGLWACMGAVIDGGVAVNGRIVIWADEWLTYDHVWGSLNACSHYWQADTFWENVVRWNSALCK